MDRDDALPAGLHWTRRTYRTSANVADAGPVRGDWLDAIEAELDHRAAAARLLGHHRGDT